MKLHNMKLTELTREQLAILRKDIVLNSLFVMDYSNSLGVDEKECNDFFDGYVDWLMEDYKGPFFSEELKARDDEENLWYYYLDYCNAC